MYERDYLAPIQRAHARASQALLDLLIREHGLVRHFVSLKRYFFHEKGDVFLQFVDVAEDVRATPATRPRRATDCERSRCRCRGGCAHCAPRQDLRRKPSLIVWPRLQALMDLAIRTSSMATDPHADNVRVESARALLFDLLLHMNARNDVLNDRYAPADDTRTSATRGRADSRSLRTRANAMRAHSAAAPQAPPDATGLQLLQLGYAVQWPVSLVINQARIMQYQLLFRFLLHLRLVEREVRCRAEPVRVSCRARFTPCLRCAVAAGLPPRQLTRTWVADTQWTQRSSPAMRRAFGLRHRMLTFIQTLQTYTMVEVLEPHWHHFHSNLDKVRACG